ncbi:MAG: glycosyltransferase family 4 protein [Gemmatimonadota bacterium]
MRIGVDATCWANRRGYGRFTRELLRACVELAPDDRFVCLLDPASAGSFDLEGENVEVVSVHQRVSPTEAAAADGNRSPRDMLRLASAAARTRVDVFFCPSVYTFFPLPRRMAAVVTIHDTIAERFPELTLPSRRARLFWTLKVRLAIRQARLILTVSEYSAREIARRLRVPGSRIRVAGEAPAPAFHPSESAERVAAEAATLGLPVGARWFTYVGGFNPHKNVQDIVRAHAELVAEHPRNPPHLLLVGATRGDVFHGNQGEIRRLIESLGTAPYVVWTGFLPDDRLRHLHSGALALLLPSEAEGFGLPAVEAAACGAPVVATTESPLPEILAGGGIFVRPSDADALKTAMRRLLEDRALREELGSGARARAGALSWERAAGRAMAALREAAA